VENYLIKKSVLWLALTAMMACNTSQASQPEDKTWLSPGKIRINNLKPGSSVSQKIQVHNGSEQAANFSIYYRIADYVEDNFAAAPAGARDWVTIQEESPVLGRARPKRSRLF
jgi:hypothetical protein